MTTSVNCPTCKKQVIWIPTSEFKPFCSERCKLIDLGEWASEQHSIAGEQAFLPDQPLDDY
ncbi:MAG: DNA gyrase inhibitor YacG [Cycloclasticus sp.]|nr:DNA gyrase inhibitor YacG [Cycloclasticus sp.]